MTNNPIARSTYRERLEDERCATCGFSSFDDVVWAYWCPKRGTCVYENGICKLWKERE